MGMLETDLEVEAVLITSSITAAVASLNGAPYFRWILNQSVLPTDRGSASVVAGKLSEIWYYIFPVAG